MGGRGLRSDMSSSKVTLIGGKNDPELTDAIDDYYLPADVRNNLDKIKDIKSYNDFKDYLDKQGIELDTDVDALKNSKANDDIPAVKNVVQKVVTAIETYKNVYGDNSLSALKKIKLYDTDLDVTAAFHYNAVGEHDPLAGTMRLSNWDVSGHTIYHELAHAYQASQAKKGEDALKYSDKIMNSYGKKLDVSYTGSNSYVKSAETMAESIAFGFTQGKKGYVDFIDYVKKKNKR